MKPRHVDAAMVSVGSVFSPRPDRKTEWGRLIAVINVCLCRQVEGALSTLTAAAAARWSGPRRQPEPDLSRASWRPEQRPLPPELFPVAAKHWGASEPALLPRLLSDWTEQTDPWVTYSWPNHKQSESKINHLSHTEKVYAQMWHIYLAFFFRNDFYLRIQTLNSKCCFFFLNLLVLSSKL